LGTRKKGNFNPTESEIESFLLTGLKEIPVNLPFPHYHRYHFGLQQFSITINSIAFLLFMDVCKCLSKENSSAMRYSDKVKQFWRIGYKLFNGKWLRFMGGSKRRGQVVVGNTEKGNFNPTESEINFAVPHRAIVSSELSPCYVV
jgi:hypothetical protein